MRTNRARALAAACIATWLTACVDKAILSPAENVTVVHAVLDAAAPDQYVVVQTTTGAERATTDVTGAQVMIIPPSGNAWIAAEERDSVPVTLARPGQSAYRVSIVYHVALSSIGDSLIPGGTYRLHITMPGGATITGSTTIPNTAPLKTTGAAATPFDLAHDALTLNWPRVAGARGYEVQVHTQLSDYSAFVDTTVTLNRLTKSSDGTLAFLANMTNQLVISAVDSNYFDYYRRGADPFSGVSAISRLDGASGVFGSIVELRRVNLAVR